jgi:hypothetical protein
VLLEQEDWFEKEIAFVRRLLRSGMRAVDIGANYGTYTLAMARAVGQQEGLGLRTVERHRALSAQQHRL